jgi:hypothetical protein
VRNRCCLGINTSTQSPYGFLIDGLGRIIVSEYANHRLQVLQ